VIAFLLLVAGCGHPREPEVSRIEVASGFQEVGDSVDGGGITRALRDMMVLGGFREELPDRNILDDLVAREAPEANEGPPRFWEGVMPGPGWAMKEVASFDGFSVQVRDTDGFDDAIAIYRNGRLLYAREGGHFFLPRTGSPVGDEDASGVAGPAAGADIDGNGIPDLLVYWFSGGAHCCFEVWHIECGRELRLRARINGWHSEPEYRDLDGDGRCEVVMRDWSFAYWNECFATNSAPEVILRMRDGRYELAWDLVNGPKRSDEEWGKLRNQVRERLASVRAIIVAEEAGTPVPAERIPEDFPIFQWWANERMRVPSEVWAAMLDLIYGGRVADAVAFLEYVWPEGVPGRNEFLRDVTGVILSSWFGQRLPWVEELVAAARDG